MPPVTCRKCIPVMKYKYETPTFELIKKPVSIIFFNPQACDIQNKTPIEKVTKSEIFKSFIESVLKAFDAPEIAKLPNNIKIVLTENVFGNLKFAGLPSLLIVTR